MHETRPGNHSSGSLMGSSFWSAMSAGCSSSGSQLGPSEGTYKAETFNQRKQGQALPVANALSCIFEKVMVTRVRKARTAEFVTALERCVSILCSICWYHSSYTRRVQLVSAQTFKISESAEQSGGAVLTSSLLDEETLCPSFPAAALQPCQECIPRRARHNTPGERGLTSEASTDLEGCHLLPIHAARASTPLRRKLKQRSSLKLLSRSRLVPQKGSERGQILIWNAECSLM